MPVLRIPTPLRAYTDGETEVSVSGQSVGEAMDSLVAAYPALRPHLYDADGRLRPFVNLFVDSKNVKDLEGLATRLQADARVLLVPSIAGG